ncbi:MAG: hypothetical protein CBB82_02645 [Betaproteobacteria bacterium TMED22]|nr:MAG: hypothetical protein CBB82_02645 [Betaproteobacteria bacterium TMED22]
MFSSHLQSRARNQRRIMYIGFIVALLCAVAAAGSGLGYRFGLWHFRTGFEILKWSFFLSGATLLVLLACMFFIQTKTRADTIIGGIGIAICLVLVYVPYSWKKTLDANPYIHDITTDTLNPPDFVVVEELRSAEEHSIEYDGLEVAKLQRRAYPELKTLVLEGDIESMIKLAEDVLNDMDLEVVSVEPAAGRVEAVATTWLFGFQDDMVIRLKAIDGAKVEVDVRSKSRVGRSDLGQNAKRIRQFMKGLTANHSAS